VINRMPSRIVFAKEFAVRVDESPAKVGEVLGRVYAGRGGMVTLTSRGQEIFVNPANVAYVMEAPPHSPQVEPTE
jgi:hypothetical protein